MNARVERADPSEARSVSPDGELPFLARWSRRKLGQEVSPDPAPPVPALAQTPEVEDALPATVETEQRIEPRSGKTISELTDDDMPDINTLDQNADLSVFMSGKVSQALRMKALTKVFHSPKFNQVCLCAEYADDYTNFVPLGDIVPHDLKQAIVREGAKLLERFAERGLTITPEEAQGRAAAAFRSAPMPEPDWARIAVEREQAGARNPAGVDECHDGDDSEMRRSLIPQQASQPVLRGDTERT